MGVFNRHGVSFRVYTFSNISFGLRMGLEVIGIISLLVKGHTNTVCMKLHREHGG